MNAFQAGACRRRMDNSRPEKYLYGELILDPNTAHRQLKLSKNDRSATMTDSEQPYSDHPDRFDSCRQVLSSSGLTGRCYWEVAWNDSLEKDVAVSYRGLNEKALVE
ncbi:hypothetical protein WMY93_026191 [Mugilogobius chulae]|uniref:SPRY-associated domain-containing protein n=1 Tax=Mugilogobius chulae TaxID=88201 RepID=A0AAW0N2H3_9GOBI